MSDVRIVDLTRALSGPFATMLLADLGADVIKVEPPGGDLARFGGPFVRGDNVRAYGGFFASVNRNKRSVVLDLTEVDDREQLRGLVREADVLVENFRPGVLEGADLSFEHLQEVNPKLVYAALRGFGDQRTGAGPYTDWPAFDIVAQAIGGPLSFTGSSDGQLAMGASVGDLYPATLLVAAILAALHEARSSGRGQFVEMSMMDALLTLSEEIIWRYSYTGTIQGPRGVRHPALSPFGVYATADSSCAIAAPTPKHWEALALAMGRADLLEDERTQDNRSRVANSHFVDECVQDWTSGRTTAEILGALAGAVPVAPVNDAAALFEDPHVRERGALVALDQPGADRPVVFPNTPFRFTGTPAAVYRRAPTLGEHQEAVLGSRSEPTGSIGWLEARS